MSQDPIPTESLAPEQQPDNKPAELRRTATIVIVCVILALPIGYLVLHHVPSRSVFANTPAAPAPAQIIATLESTAKASPTPANLLNLSLAYINANIPGRAIPILVSLVADDRNNAAAWNNLCVANTLQQDYKAAISDCDHALQIDPNLQLAKNNLKWAEDEKQKTIDSISAQEQAGTASRDAAFYLKEGLDYFHLGDYDQAIKAWQHTLELDPRDASAANNIGTAYMLKQQTSEAVVWFNKSLAIDPNLQLTKNNLAWAHDEQAKAAK